jgi:hypothetical protein
MKTILLTVILILIAGCEKGSTTSTASSNERWQKYSPEHTVDVDMNTLSYHKPTDNGRVDASAIAANGQYYSSRIQFYCQTNLVFMNGYKVEKEFTPFPTDFTGLLDTRFSLADEEKLSIRKFLCPKVGQIVR